MPDYYIHTIGHGAKAVEDFLAELKVHNIHYLIDVRSRPFSRFHSQFSKREIRKTLNTQNITYLWLGYQLGGIPEDVNVYVNGQLDYQLLGQTEYFQKGLDRLRAAHTNKVKVAIMCGEKMPHNCHRTKLIGKLLELEAIPVLHIMEGSKTKDQKTVVLEANKGRSETDLFDQSE